MLPFAILGAQCAVVTTASAGFTFWVKTIFTFGTQTIEAVKSIPARANIHLSTIGKRLSWPEQLPRGDAPRASVEANLVIAQAVGHQRRLEHSGRQQERQQHTGLWPIDICGA